MVSMNGMSLFDERYYNRCFRCHEFDKTSQDFSQKDITNLNVSVELTMFSAFTLPLIKVVFILIDIILLRLKGFEFYSVRNVSVTPEIYNLNKIGECRVRVSTFTRILVR